MLDLLLVLCQQPRGSGDLAQAVGELRGHEVPLATFYRRLQKAVDNGWVRTDDGAEARSGPGRPERLYVITDIGERALRAGMEQQQRRVALAQSMGLLMEGTP